MRGETKTVSFKRTAGAFGWQPWAHAIMHLGKDVENKSRRTLHRPVSGDDDGRPTDGIDLSAL